MIIWDAEDPAETLSTLRTSQGASVSPTVRWSEEHQSWNSQRALHWTERTLTKQPCVYGIYVRREPFLKWLNRSVFRLLHDFRASLGSGSLGHEEPIRPFEVPDTNLEPLGPWVLLYVGESGALGTSAPRLEQYFGAGGYSAKAGQSMKMIIALLLADPIDTRYGKSGSPESVESRMLHYYGRSLQERFTDMVLSYVQVLTNAAPGATPDDDGDYQVFSHASPCPHPGRCRSENEQALIRLPHGDTAPNGHPWPTGARPMMNGAF